MKIEITSKAVDVRTGTSKEGKPFRAVSQNAYLWLDGKPYPKEFRLSIDEAAPYPIGQYRLDDSAFTVSQYGDLQINRFELRLIPLVEIPEAVIPIPEPLTVPSSNPLFGRKTG